MRYTDDGIGVVLAAHGTLALADLLAADDALKAERERFESLAYMLIDESRVQSISLRPTGIQELAFRAQRSATMLNGGLIAMASPLPALYGFNRMWKLLTQGPFEIFVSRARGEAVAWLDRRMLETRGVATVLGP